ncbi:hypothetical protein FOZ63_011265, partial [Perkinsus olseni]
MVGLSKLLGYEMKTTSSRNPKANGRVERAHRSLGLILDTMLHTGDGKDADDLRVYLAAAESRANLKINPKDQVSVHGAVYGQQPNSLMTKAIVEDIQDVEIQAEDVQQIARVARYATDALADERDMKAHYNAGVRIAQVHQGRLPDISEGDKILHQGVEDVVEKIYIADNSASTLPDDRPVHLPTNAIDDDKVKVDDYALVKASDDRVAVVRIINIKPGKEVEGHIYDAGEKGTVFLPLWSVDGVFKRAKSQPPRSTPALLTTPYDKILFKVELNLTGRMKPASRDRMHAVHVQYAA